MPRDLAAVAFDFDGVILDSETAEYESHRLIFERCGTVLTSDEWCHHVGVWTEDHERIWCERLRQRSERAPDDRTFRSEQIRLFRALLPQEPMRGIGQLLDALAEAAVPIAIASSGPSRWVGPALERLGLAGRFAAIVTADDVARRKPAPDVYLEAARRLDVEPRRAVAIEDSGPGIVAATRAGMRTVAVPHWLTERHDLGGATLRVAHAGEITVDVLDRIIRSP
jgi:HAD superfamily hydrolase (TIGR01509 family)